MYKDWKIKISDFKQNPTLQTMYVKVAKWCNETGQFYITEKDGFYVVQENPLYQPLEGKDLRSELLSAQLTETTYENISPTTYFNVMIKL